MLLQIIAVVVVKSQSIAEIVLKLLRRCQLELNTGQLQLIRVCRTVVRSDHWRLVKFHIFRTLPPGSQSAIQCTQKLWSPNKKITLNLYV